MPTTFVSALSRLLSKLILIQKWYIGLKLYLLPQLALLLCRVSSNKHHDTYLNSVLLSVGLIGGRHLKEEEELFSIEKELFSRNFKFFQFFLTNNNK